MDLRGTTAIVTGAASGLGAATARNLAERGARVFGFDLPSAVKDVAPFEGITLFAVDVTSLEDVAAGVTRAAEVGPLRTVVNCAGIAPSTRILGRNGVHDLALFDRVVRINLVGSFNVLSQASARMAEAEPTGSGLRGVVVNTASIAAYDGQVGQAAYAASKGGVASLTLAAARDLAQHGIRVMCIAPGLMLTPLMETISEEFRSRLAASVPCPSRFGDPEEFARLVLAIVDNDYLNGEVIRLDGSLRMAPR